MYAQASASSAVLFDVAPTTQMGSASSFAVVGSAPGGWLEVRVPVRPNGGIGWVEASRVNVGVVDTAVTVDLASRILKAYKAGVEVLSTRVAVGSARTPTPPGEFYVTDRVSTGRPDGAYGPWVFGLSGHSDVLFSFNGGDGQLAIHGTNAPQLIGEAASNGCVRVPNDVATALSSFIGMGTPVTIS